MVTAAFRSRPTRDLAHPRWAHGALRPPARSQKLWLLVTKSLPGCLCRAARAQVSGGAAGQERELGHESRLAAVRAGGRSVCAGGGASTSILAARGTRLRRPFSPCRFPQESGFTAITCGAWPSAAGDRRSAWLQKPALLRKDPVLPQCPEALCKNLGKPALFIAFFFF